MEITPGATQSFPNINIPDSQKDEAWHKQAVESITKRSLNQSYTINYVMMNQSVNFFQSLQTGDEYKFLQESQDGDVLPAKWMNLNRIRPKLTTVLGGFMEKGWEIDVKAINTEAVSQKLEIKEQKRVQIRMKPTAQMMAEHSGLDFGSNEEVPDSEEELDDHMESYKSTSEFIMWSALDWLSKLFEWDYTRSKLFLDILIMGRCFAKIEIVNGLPVIRRIDPRLMIFDTNATDDFLTDSTYFGEVRYMSMPEAIEHYGLTKDEIELIKNSTKSDSNLTNSVTSFNQDFISSRDNQILYYKQEAGELRVLVVTGYWADTKSYNHKISKDQYGTEHIKRVKDTDQGEDITKKRIKIWRRGTIVGGRVLKEWGEMENQPRDRDNLCETYPPYIACIPFFMNGVGVSIVQLLKPLQDLKDITMYNISLAMSRAGAKGFIYDLAQLPDDMSIEQVIKYLKVVGIGLIDSKKDGLPSNFNQFQQYDMSISESVSQYIGIMNMIDAEMDAISGINEARQGVAQGASQAVGVTQSLLLQSNLSTAPLEKLYRIFASRCLSQQAKLVKIAWAGKEKFAPIIGDVGVDFLKEDIDLDLQDYGVFVQETPPLIDDIRSFREFVMAALQSGNLEFIDALELMQEKNLKLATRKYRKAIQAKQESDQQHEQQMQAQQAQQQALMQQAQAQSDAQAQQQTLAAEENKEQLKGANQLKNTFAKGKIQLAEKKIDLLK